MNWDGVRFVGVGIEGNTGVSKDGIEWTYQKSPSNQNLFKVIYNGSKYVAIGSRGDILYSTNAIDWNLANSDNRDNLSDITWNGEKFLIAGYRSILTSSSGESWSIQKLDTSILHNVACSSSKCVILGYYGQLWTSEDLVHWTKGNTWSVQTQIHSLHWNGRYFIAGGSSGTVLVSKEGWCWSTAERITDGSYYDMDWNGERYLLVGSYGTVVSGIPVDMVKVKVNGEPIVFEQEPVIRNDSTLVPLRAIFERLGVTILWDPATETVTASKSGLTLSLQVRSPIAYVNGQSQSLDTAMELVNGNAMVPVRFVSESMGAKVEWDEVTKTILISY
jgi:hypothetical protein